MPKKKVTFEELLEIVAKVELKDLKPPMAPKFTDTQPSENKWSTKEHMEIDLKNAEKILAIPNDYVPIVDEKSVNEANNPMSSRSGMKTETDSTSTIDFEAIAKTSEFQRFIYFVRTGKVFRGSNAKLEDLLWKTQQDINDIREIKRIDPNARNFGSVMTEFKDKIERLRKK